MMPAGVPVATMALGASGAKNAAVFAAQILALSDPAIRTRLEQHKKDLAAGVTKQTEQIPPEYRGQP
jgi:phosphoribosylcarboxyaminoimidazole (NCAIR) mutase